MDLKYFELSEFACRHCGESHMDPEYLARLDLLREDFGSPIVVTSGYRCPEYNTLVASSGARGPHTTGKAADLSVRGPLAHRLAGLAYQHGFSGIGVQQKGSSRFLHLDTLPNSPTSPRPWLWSY